MFGCAILIPNQKSPEILAITGIFEMVWTVLGWCNWFKTPLLSTSHFFPYHSWTFQYQSNCIPNHSNLWRTLCQCRSLQPFGGYQVFSFAVSDHVPWGKINSWLSLGRLNPSSCAEIQTWRHGISALPEHKSNERIRQHETCAQMRSHIHHILCNYISDRSAGDCKICKRVCFKVINRPSTDMLVKKIKQV